MLSITDATSVQGTGLVSSSIENLTISAISTNDMVFGLVAETVGCSNGCFQDASHLSLGPR